jgi:hypothetical protein
MFRQRARLQCLGSVSHRGCLVGVATRARCCTQIFAKLSGAFQSRSAARLSKRLAKRPVLRPGGVSDLQRQFAVCCAHGHARADVAQVLHVFARNLEQSRTITSNDSLVIAQVVLLDRVLTLEFSDDRSLPVSLVAAVTTQRRAVSLSAPAQTHGDFSHQFGPLDDSQHRTIYALCLPSLRLRTRMRHLSSTETQSMIQI